MEHDENVFIFASAIFAILAHRSFLFLKLTFRSKDRPSSATNTLAHEPTNACASNMLTTQK